MALDLETREQLIDTVRRFVTERLRPLEAKVSEDDRAIKIETDKLEAVIPKKNPKQWMTGIEKGSFLSLIHI